MWYSIEGKVARLKELLVRRRRQIMDLIREGYLLLVQALRYTEEEGERQLP